MSECGNEKCSSWDVEYPGNCSNHWRSNCHHCKSFTKYEPNKVWISAEALKYAQDHLDSHKNMVRNGRIVRRLQELLGEGVRPKDIIKELKGMLV